VRSASGRHRGAVTAARFTPDGRSLITTSDDGDAILWASPRRGGRDAARTRQRDRGAASSAPDGRTLYTAGLDGAVFSVGPDRDASGWDGRSRPVARTGRSPR
jgi:WD40 repeat protein